MTLMFNMCLKGTNYHGLLNIIIINMIKMNDIVIVYSNGSAHEAKIIVAF